MQLQVSNWLNSAQMNLLPRRQISVSVVVDVGWIGVKCKLWVQQCFIVTFYTILLVVIHSSKNKTEKSMVLL